MDAAYTDLAAAVVAYRPRWLTYDDGGGTWRCLVADEEERGEGDLSPGGTLLRIEAAAGARFGVHNHYSPDGVACTEIFTVVRGLFEVTTQAGNDPLLLSPGDSLRVPPGEEHAVHAVTACVVWAASIPTARGYGHVADPDGAGA